MKTRAFLVALLLIVFGAAPRATNAATNFQWGWVQQLQFQQASNGQCTPTARIWSKELGPSGVTRLRARFEKRGPNDPGWAPTYWKSAWLMSGIFPDDNGTYIQDWGLGAGAVYISPYSAYAVWAKLIGERPSLWQPDLKIHVELGEGTCAVIGYG